MIFAEINASSGQSNECTINYAQVHANIMPTRNIGPYIIFYKVCVLLNCGTIMPVKHTQAVDEI